MFERFTERARQVVVFAQEEARALEHAYIGSEHLLLGLLREQHGLGAQALETLGVTLEAVRAQIALMVEPGDRPSPSQLPFTPRAKQALESAVTQALSFGHNYVGSEHILLGLVRANEGVATRVLLELGTETQAVGLEVRRMLSGESELHQPWPGAPPAVEVWNVPGRISRLLRELLRVAAARALDDGRTEIELRDLLLVLARDDRMVAVLDDLDLSEADVADAIKRHASDPD